MRKHFYFPGLLLHLDSNKSSWRRSFIINEPLASDWLAVWVVVASSMALLMSAPPQGRADADVRFLMIGCDSWDKIIRVGSDWLVFFSGDVISYRESHSIF